MKSSYVKSIAVFAVAFALAGGAYARVEVPIAGDLYTVEVAGTVEQRMVEPELRVAHGLHVTSYDTVTGSLSGTALSQVYSRTFVDNGTGRNTVSMRVLFTNDGQLFLREVGERVGNVIHVRSLVTGGTGIFRNATGQLTMEGRMIDSGAVHYAYRGSITFVQ